MDITKKEGSEKSMQSSRSKECQKSSPFNPLTRFRVSTSESYTFGLSWGLPNIIHVALFQAAPLSSVPALKPPTP